MRWSDRSRCPSTDEGTTFDDGGTYAAFDETGDVGQELSQGRLHNNGKRDVNLRFVG